MPVPLSSQAKEHMRVYTYILLCADTHPHPYLFHVYLYKYIENHAFTPILAIPVQHHNVHSSFLSSIGGSWQPLSLPYLLI